MRFFPARDGMQFLTSFPASRATRRTGATDGVRISCARRTPRSPSLGYERRSTAHPRLRNNSTTLLGLGFRLGLDRQSTRACLALKSTLGITEMARNPRPRSSPSKWITAHRHRLSRQRQSACDVLPIRSDDDIGAKFDQLDPFGFVSQGDAWDTMEIRFFLYSPAVGSDQRGMLLEHHHVEVPDRLDRLHRFRQ